MLKFEQSKRLYLVFGILFLYLILPYVSALHTPTVSITPFETTTNTDTEFEVLVTNQAGDNINTFELLIPETRNEKPYYLIKEIGSPAGWTYAVRYKLDEIHPYKIIWSTAGIGITKGGSLKFSFTATSPTVVGSFNWIWKTIDTTDNAVMDKFTTTTILAPLADFNLTVPKSTVAGEYFNITVVATDEEGKIKKDFTGMVTFTSSDPLAILPANYTFTLGDRGLKVFQVKLKTAGNQTISVASGKISKTSNKILVNSSEPVAIKIPIQELVVTTGGLAKFDAYTVDVFGNEVDVTNKINWTIDKEAGGKWYNNSYETEKIGKWTVIANYSYKDKIFITGATLIVKEKVEEKILPEKVSERRLPVRELKLYTIKTISIGPGKSDSLSLSVKNTGDINLTEVQISWSGVPHDWITISPTIADIAVGQSANFIAKIAIPENETGTRTITFEALSAEEISDTVNVTLKISEVEEQGPSLVSRITGLVVKVVRTPAYLGIAIAIIVIILIIWKLFFPRPKRRKTES